MNFVTQQLHGPFRKMNAGQPYARSTCLTDIISLMVTAVGAKIRYFIRVPSTGREGLLLGPFDPIETLQKIRQLRESGIDYFITDESGMVVVSEEEIRRSEG